MLAVDRTWQPPVMVVGAARIVPLLDFLEKTNFIQTIILRWLHQLLQDASSSWQEEASTAIESGDAVKLKEIYRQLRDLERVGV